MNQKLNFADIKLNVLVLMIFSIFYSQPSHSQTTELRLNFQNQKDKFDFKVLDSWVYINDFGEIRYDLPKFRVQRLERFGRQYSLLDTAFQQSQLLVNQISQANINLQAEIMQLQPTISNLKSRNDELIRIHNRLTVMYNNSLDENEELELKLEETKEKAKRYRSQRNWTIGGIAVLVTAAILSR